MPRNTPSKTCFNGAAPEKARKAILERLVAQAEASLQWGRA